MIPPSLATVARGLATAAAFSMATNLYGSPFAWVDQISGGESETGRLLPGGIAIREDGDAFFSFTLASQRDVGIAPREEAGRILRYSPEGELRWARTLERTDRETFSFPSVVADSTGNAIAVGYSFDSPPAPTSLTTLAEYRDDGEFLGQVDDAGGIPYENAATLDLHGNILVGGLTAVVPNPTPELSTLGGWVAKYDNDGTRLWSDSFGAPDGRAVFGIDAGDDGSVFAVGSNASSSPGDGFLRKYTADGDLLWETVFATPSDEYVLDVEVDGSGNAIVSGWTRGDLGAPNAGEADIFVSSVSPSGDVLWTTQFGADGFEAGRDLFIDDAGRIVVAGATNGLLGQEAFGGFDGYVSVLNSTGSLLSTTQFGTDQDERDLRIAPISANQVFVMGGTQGSLGEAFSGARNDLFIGALNLVPEPSSALLMATSGTLFLRRWRRVAP